MGGDFHAQARNYVLNQVFGFISDYISEMRDTADLMGNKVFSSEVSENH